MTHNPELTPNKPPGAGKSSFDLIEPEKLLKELPLREGLVIADLGCGAGNYSLALAEAVGSPGLIYALDLWEEGIETLTRRAAAAGRKNIRARVADVSQLIPLADESLDLCLMATVLHDLAEFGLAEGALRETARILKPGGTLAVVEFDKVDGPPGPPKHIRLCPEEVEALAAPYGFKRTRTARIGLYNYLILFNKI
jgi:ubiquinone/menaquinone biosynthesis C-methylase UbiE